MESSSESDEAIDQVRSLWIIWHSLLEEPPMEERGSLNAIWQADLFVHGSGVTVSMIL